jgi:phage-related protein
MAIRIPIFTNYDNKGVKDAEGALEKLGSSVKKIGALVATAFAAVQVTDFVKDSINAASSFEAEFEGVNQVFGEAAKSVQDFADQAAYSAGISETAALQAAKNFGGFATAAGLAGQDAASFSTQLVQAAGDLASFNDVPVDQALSAISSGLAGSAEPLRNFRIFLDQTTLSAQAMAMGLGDNFSTLSAGEQTLVRQAAIMEQLGVAQGDFVNYSDTYGNSLKTVTALYEEMQAQVGSALLPVMAEFTKALQPVIDALLPVVLRLMESLGPVITLVAENMLPLIEALMPLVDLFGYLIEALTPILDEILPILIDAIAEIAPLFLLLAEALMPLVEYLAPVLAELLAALVPVAVDLIEAFIPIIEKLLPHFIALIDGLLPFLNFLIEIMGTYLVPAIEAFGDVLGDVGVYFLQLFALAFEDLGKVLTPVWNNTIKPILDGLMSFFGIEPKPLNASVTVTATKAGDPEVWNLTKPGGGLDLGSIDLSGATGATGGKGGGKSAAEKEAEKTKKAQDAFKKSVSEITKEIGKLNDVAEAELGDFQQAVRDSFGDLRGEITKALEDGAITKAQAKTLRDFVKDSQKLMEEIAKKRDQIAEQIKNTEKKLADSKEFQASISTLAGSLAPLKRVEDEFGRFESSVITAFDEVESRIAEGVELGTFTEVTAATLRAAADTEAKYLRKISSQRDELARQYESLVEKLDSAKALRASTRESIAALADLKSLGNTSKDIISNLSNLVQRTSKFREQLKALQAAGLNKDLFSQIVASGAEAGSATAEALLAGGPSAISEINGLFTELNAVGDQIGLTTSEVMFDGGEAAIQGLIEGIISQDTALFTQAQESATLFFETFQTTVDESVISLQSLLDGLKAQDEALRLQGDALGTTVGTAIMDGINAAIAGRSITLPTPTIPVIGTSGLGSTTGLTGTSATGGNTVTINVTANDRLGGVKAGEAIVQALRGYTNANGSILNVVLGNTTVTS